MRLVADTRAEWRGLDVRIDAPNADLAEHARNDAAASRLLSTPGIGVLGARR